MIKNFNQNVCTQLPNCADADGDMKRFHKEKSEWGFAKLITLEAFKNSSNGYLVDDCCEFGAEVFVYSRNSEWESLAMVKEPSDGTFRYEMENFSAKTQSSYDSKAFTVGERNWYALVPSFALLSASMLLYICLILYNQITLCSN